MIDFSSLCIAIGGKMVGGACRVSSKRIDFLIKPTKQEIEIKDKKIIIDKRELLGVRPYPSTLKTGELIEIKTKRGIALAGPHTPIFYDDKGKLRPITKELWEKFEHERVYGREK